MTYDAAPLNPFLVQCHVNRRRIRNTMHYSMYNGNGIGHFTDLKYFVFFVIFYLNMISNNKISTRFRFSTHFYGEFNEIDRNQIEIPSTKCQSKCKLDSWCQLHFVIVFKVSLKIKVINIRIHDTWNKKCVHKRQHRPLFN